jgi:integrase
VREKLVIWTLLDTGRRVSELARLSPAQIDWQGHRLTIYGQDGPYGAKAKRRISGSEATKGRNVSSPLGRCRPIKKLQGAWVLQ